MRRAVEREEFLVYYLDDVVGAPEDEVVAVRVAQADIAGTIPAVMQRIALREAGALPEVVVWTMGSSAVRLLVADASMARWLP